jgi:putative glutamine amidotransferase
MTIATLEKLAAPRSSRRPPLIPTLTCARHRHEHRQRKPPVRQPVIGVNCDLVTQGKAEFCFVHDLYLERLHRAGAAIVVITPYNEVLPEALDGLLMIDGRDLDPRDDGFELHRSHHLMHPRRNAADRRLVADARNRRLPLLALGAGMQALNVVCGGTLSYHIPDDYPQAIPHYDASDEAHSHPIAFLPGSLCEAIYCATDANLVRSQHHQAVDDVAPGFVATAWSPDGIVEAIESVTDWPALGLQWHPEFANASLIDRLAFKYFVALAARD